MKNNRILESNLINDTINEMLIDNDLVSIYDIQMKIYQKKSIIIKGYKIKRKMKKEYKKYIRQFSTQ